MRIRGDVAPSNKFSIGIQPKKAGFVVVRFYENVKAFEEPATENQNAMKGFEYDEYQLELENRFGLENDINANYDTYLTQAKLAEAEGKTIPNLQEQVANLEAEKTALQEQVINTQLALCDVYEQVLNK